MTRRLRLTTLLPTTLLLLAVAACTDDTPDPCPGYTLSDTALTVNSTEQPVQCVSPAYTTANADEAFVQFIAFSDDLRLVVFFPDLNPHADASAWPATIEISKASIERATGDAPDGWEVVCNTVIQGSELVIEGISVDDAEVDEDGTPNPFTWFNGFRGSIDLSLAGCDVPELGVTSGTLHVEGDLNWHAK